MSLLSFKSRSVLKIGEYLSIRPVARISIIQLVGQKRQYKVSKCKFKKYLFGEKNERKTGEFRYSMTIIIRPLVA